MNCSDEIAGCIEKAYEQIQFSEATRVLFFSSPKKMTDYAKKVCTFSFWERNLGLILFIMSILQQNNLQMMKTFKQREWILILNLFPHLHVQLTRDFYSRKNFKLQLWKNKWWTIYQFIAVIMIENYSHF